MILTSMVQTSPGKLFICILFLGLYGLSRMMEKRKDIYESTTDSRKTKSDADNTAGV